MKRNTILLLFIFPPILLLIVSGVIGTNKYIPDLIIIYGLILSFFCAYFKGWKYGLWFFWFVLFALLFFPLDMG
jgi:hypothetical protein